MKYKIQKVFLEIKGSKVIGNLYIPSNWSRGPACVVAGPMTSVKEQVTGVYAKALAERGVMALSIDHRHYGESEGEPRQFEYYKHKIEDLIGCVDYLSEKKDVEQSKLGIFGICLGCGYSVWTAVETSKVKWLGCVVGYYRHPKQMRKRNPKEFDAKVSQGIEARKKYENEKKNTIIPAVAINGDAAMTLKETYDYYAAEWAVPNYRNEFSLMSREHFLPFDVQKAASRFETPIVMVHSKNALSPHLAKMFYGNVTAPKSLKWLHSNNQVEFYSKNNLIENSVEFVLNGHRLLYSHK